MLKVNRHIISHILFVLLCFFNSQLFAQKENIASDFVEIQKDTLGKQYHFYISKFAVSVKEYQDYLRFLGLKLPEPPNYGWKNKTLPMVLVSYKDALSYTNWMTDVFQVQFRLPTEIEWMLAEDSNQKQIHISKEIPICTDCASPNKNGIYGMNGNVWEWTSTLKDKEFNILKGGSYADDSDKNLKENTFAISPSLKLIDVGFRLVMDVNEMKKYEFAFKVDEVLKKLFPEYTNIRVEPYGLYLNDGEISWKQQRDIVKIDFGKLKLEFCCLEYANSKNSLEHKIVAFPFAKNDVKRIKKLEKLINKRNLDLFK